jgi:hypothetical protein
MDLPDYVIPPPAMPAAGTEVVWFDTGDGGMLSHTGVIGTVLFDQEVTLYVRKASAGGELFVANGGSGEVLPPNVPREITVRLAGGRTQIALKPTVDCTVWHVDARLTSRPL